MKSKTEKVIMCFEARSEFGICCKLISCICYETIGLLKASLKFHCNSKLVSSFRLKYCAL
jgi:hypothetical protein